MKVELFEGYIRNRKALCDELKVMPLKSLEETELKIIKEAFRRWRYGFCSRIYGAFAFVIRDEESGELFLARDQMGQKSLFYYMTQDGSLLYGTTPADIVRDKRYRIEIDHEALQIYMMFGYPAGEKTLYKGVRKLPPGTYLLCRNGRVVTCEYDRLVFHPDASRSEEAWMEEIETTLRGILREDLDHLRGRREGLTEAGSFLSGGVDSSYLLALSNVRKAFGIGYCEDAYSEAGPARATARRLGAEFSEIRITADDFFRELPEVIKTWGLPVADPSAAVFAMGCSRLKGDRSMSPPLSAMFSGEGADEFLAGYHIYRRAGSLARTGGPMYFGCDRVMKAAPAGQLLMLDRIYPGDGLLEELYRRTENLEETEHLSRLLLIDIRIWFEGDILFCADRTAHANGLDLFLPYADRRFFELASGIPSSLKLKDGVGKYILRRTAEKVLPHETAFREKRGFAVPAKVWLQQEKYRRDIESLFFGTKAAQYFDLSLLRRYWISFLEGKEALWRFVYAVYVFLLWEEEVTDKKRIL